MLHTHMRAHVREYYSSMIKNEILPFTVTRIELESILLTREHVHHSLLVKADIEDMQIDPDIVRVTLLPFL